jgi:hypothetical protein
MKGWKEVTVTNTNKIPDKLVRAFARIDRALGGMEIGDVFEVFANIIAMTIIEFFPKEHHNDVLDALVARIRRCITFNTQNTDVIH